jgi:TetR/AcrR family transcriptional regulator
MTKIHSQEQLIAAAEKVFLARGYEAARLEDIGAELGVLQGSLYYHIGSKAGLLRLVLRQRFTQMTLQIEAIAAGPGEVRDKLRAALVVDLGYRHENLPEAPYWFRNAIGPKETADDVARDRQLVRRFRKALEDILTEGIERGEIRADLDVSDTALAILGMCNYVLRWHEGEPLSLEAVTDSQLALAWAGLAP